MDRRKFLTTTGLSAMSVSVFGSLLFNQTENTVSGNCATTNDILGPFYRENAPIRSQLRSADYTGCPIEIKGKIYGKDCKTLLDKAQIEIWHCNPDGEYDNKTAAFKYRARQITKTNGLYSFETVLPGKYLNGKLYRPAHVHFRVSHPNSDDLISQLYFAGDPEIESDPWASNPKAAQRILPITPIGTDGKLVVTFDIYLNGI